MDIYFDGKYISADQQKLQSLVPGCVSGRGVFETIDIQNKKARYLSEHMERLQRGLRFFKLKKTINAPHVQQILRQLVKKNHIHDGRLRVSVWRHDACEHVAMVLRKQNQHKKDIRLCVASQRRPLSSSSHLKSIQYHVFYEAGQEARQRGYDDALLLNKHGRVVETSTANVFWMKGDDLFTPAVRSGCLNGITRGRVLKAAPYFKLKTRIGLYDLDHLKKADVCFVTNALIGVAPVCSLDGKIFKKSQLIVALARQISL